MDNWIEHIRQQQMDLAKMIALQVADELQLNDEFLEPFKHELNQINKKIGSLLKNFDPNEILDFSENAEQYQQLLKDELFEDTLICLEEFTDFAVEQILDKNIHPNESMIYLDWASTGQEYKNFVKTIVDQTEMHEDMVKIVLKHLIKNDLEIPILGTINRDISGMVHLAKNVEMLKKWKKLLDVEKEAYNANLEDCEPAPSMQRISN